MAAVAFVTVVAGLQLVAAIAGPTCENTRPSTASSRDGGGFLIVSISTLMGCTLAMGGLPVASSIRVIPNDQMSAEVLYLQAVVGSNR